ncbi:MAG: arylsulfatase, partial [Opitutaceae bacterium]
IHVGSDRESPSVLTPCHWREGSLDQQNGIRRKKQNGAWDLFVEHDGDYEISLRRWPIEANAAITAGMPEFVPTDRGAVTETFRFRAAEPIPIASAHVAIGGASQSKPVARGDLEITFVASLSRGPAELRAWFSDAGKNELCGAYYVYVRRKRGE